MTFPKLLKVLVAEWDLVMYDLIGADPADPSFGNSQVEILLRFHQQHHQLGDSSGHWFQLWELGARLV
jgi:hypothetical protein